jgi:DNA-binding Lrp family transcriptional regulator
MQIGEPEIDEILTILARDARTPVETIATMVGKTADQVRSAITAYEKAGVIKRYKTVIDFEKVGSESVVAFIDVRVTPARDVGFDGIAARIAKFPEVQSVWLVSGSSDLRVMIESAHIRELGRFVAEKLSTINGVTGTVTNFIMRRYKEDHVMFIETEEDQRLVVSP